MAAQIDQVSSTRREADRFVNELEGLVAAAVKEMAGVDDATAARIGNSVATRMSASLGGQSFYLGKAHAIETRDRLIYAAWRAGPGDNYLELGRQHGLSERHTRFIIENFDADERRKRQPDLFVKGAEG
ncbi:MAG TPA: Mor transcription activator family protein [Usitatibacteraceae bacterium]